MSIKQLREIPTGLPLVGCYYRWGIKFFGNFRPITPYILQTIQDSTMVTTLEC